MRSKGVILAIGIVAIIRLGVWWWPESPPPARVSAPPVPANVPQRLPPALRTHLEASEVFVLYSLDPRDDDAQRERLKKSRFNLPVPARRPDRFRGYGVSNWIELHDAKIRTQLVAAINAGIQANPGIVASCFNPHHGIHAVRGTQTMDLVICFECLSLRVYGLMETGYPTEAHARLLLDHELGKNARPVAKSP